VKKKRSDFFPIDSQPDHIPEMIREIGITQESEDYDLALSHSPIKYPYQIPLSNADVAKLRLVFTYLLNKASMELSC